MRTKNFTIILISLVIGSVLFLVFGQHKPDTIQNIVSTTHQQIRNFKDALRHTGAILFLECSYRFMKHVNQNVIMELYKNRVTNQGILAWPLKSKNPVSSLTHKKMFEYFHTDAENFLFLQMVNAEALLIVNTPSMHTDIMLPWIQCALTQDCIIPIGAQSAGCKFDKKPQYRYSGCHSYDASALNIVLGLKFKLDSSQYTYSDSEKLFDVVALNKAVALLKELEQNSTTEGHFLSLETP